MAPTGAVGRFNLYGSNSPQLAANKRAERCEAGDIKPIPRFAQRDSLLRRCLFVRTGIGIHRTMQEKLAGMGQCFCCSTWDFVKLSEVNPVQTINTHRDINALITDAKSVITAFGKHNRVVAFLPGFDKEFDCVTLYARVDHVNGLRDPDENEVLTVARKDQHVKGRYSLLEKTTYDNGKCTDYHFEKLTPNI